MLCGSVRDVVDHLGEPFNAAACTMTAVRFGSQDLVAQCLPVGAVAARCRRRTGIVALLLGTEDDEPFTLAWNPVGTGAPGCYVLQPLNSRLADESE